MGPNINLIPIQDIINKQNQQQMGPIAGAAVTGAANNIFDIAFSGIKQKQQLRGQKKALEQQNAAAMDMWHKTNYGPQMEELEKAGLNPGLIYGMSGGGATTTGPASAMPSAQHASAGMDIGQMVQVGLMKAQERLLNAQAADLESHKPKNVADTNLTNEQAKTQQAETIIKQYLAKAGKNDYEEKYMDQDDWSTEHNKDMGAQRQNANWQESIARQGIAQVISTNYLNGDLQKASNEELNKLIGQNKLDEKQLQILSEELKSKQTDNQVRELQKDLEIKLGLDKESPAILKMIGRFLLSYTSLGKFLDTKKSK